ncbi:parasitic phase-specific protein PSP-1 [Patellaria atrata CBS 101060]|uniref:Parasitic phase-specific protein PSP-1 n=1 Tax=Patellaria atrata CBS 101060 TaxID=1346257 RepID=A0A9P4VSX7_9PEZI|nr:parasitic phase-specific protein PSP-1 [Patellaria atrata CBS 101060]
MSFSLLLPRVDLECTKDTCDAIESIIGYAPSLAASVIFTTLFALMTIALTIQGILTRTPSFTIAMTLGCICEAIGYAGRIILHSDPFHDAGFKLQVVLLTFAPAFLAAGLYLCLKHLVIIFGAEFSRIKPAWYTYLFISCDVFSIALQGAGGGLASAADEPGSLLDAGNNLMMAGLAFQVFTLTVFAAMCAEYGLRVYRNRHGLNPATEELRRSVKFRGFLAALVVSYLAIQIRCTYRIAEMSGGWGSEIMRDEPLFVGLDSVMCVLAVAVLVVFNPGYCFRYQSFGRKEEDGMGVA